MIKAVYSRALVGLILLFALDTAAPAQQDSLIYSRQETMIRMRDGIRLYTVIYNPTNAIAPLPFLLLRTPYGVSQRPSPAIVPYVQDMAKDGYIFVYQDIRGRYRSEGTFEMQRFTRDKNDPKAIDESTDTYDTIDWLLSHIRNNNGKAGMYGVSYDGWTTVMGELDPHPALRAVSEQATPADMFLGDDFHHNGAFRLSYGMEYAFMEEAAKTDSLFPFPDYDTYNWYLRLGPLSNVNRLYFHNKVPTWNNYVAHPNYDSFWQKQALASRLDYPRIPILNVAGWWDQEDFYGPQETFKVLAEKDTSHRNFLVIGPWNHGGWGRGEGSKLGNIEFHSPTGQFFRSHIQAAWFAYYLKGEGKGNFPTVRSFQTGSDRWMSYDRWPPADSKTENLYLTTDGGLSFDRPAEHPSIPFLSYVSDPAKPVPYRNRPVEETYGKGSRWYTWLTEDQRFVDQRPDVLSWETPPLDHDLTVTGNITAKIYASTSGSDADWVVKLIDVYPASDTADYRMGGYELMVANDVFRGRFRESFIHPRAIVPGSVNLYTIDLHALDHVFLKGHRIMVQVQSTWFPIIDRNPQTWVSNIFLAKATDFRAATQRIYGTLAAPSSIMLPVRTP
jgi:putative CocE/NonD family hydrolase